MVCSTASARIITFDDSTFVGPTTSVVDGRLTNIGSDGLTHVMLLPQWTFGGRPSDHDCFGDPYFFGLFDLAVEIPGSEVAISGTDFACLGDNEPLTRLPAVEFVATAGHVNAMFHEWVLTPPLRLDGTYQVISIDNVFVPEPSSFVLAVAALLLIAGRLRWQPR